MDAVGEPAQQDEYPGSAVLGAALAAFFFPVVSFIVALVLMGRQSSERKRAQLRTWAWASAGRIAVQVVVVAIVFAAVASSAPKVDRSGPCQGGPEIGAAGKSIGSERYAFPCAFGGTVTMRIP